MSHSTKRFPLIFCALLIISVSKATGQPTYNLPAVINPSPQSQAFTRYGDYPMSDYTGLTDITIPIHTVTGRKLSLPITMSFHASGRMANEINGLLGIRWTLNCGGLVTRTMKGAPDEWNMLSPYTVPVYSAPPSYDDLYGACPDGKLGGPFYDSEFDIFSYALPNGKQGHFILKNQNGVKVPMLIPYEPLKIEFAKAGSSNGYYEYINITDVDGTKYRFGKIDASTADAIESTPEYDQQAGILGSIPTAWYLTKIISSDGADEISLFYTSRYIRPYYATQSATVYDRNRDDDSQFWMAVSDPYQFYLQSLLVTYHFEWTDVIVNSGSNNPSVPALSGIQFNGGSVAFIYAYAGRSDQLLTEMTVNKGSIPYKKIKFNISKHAGEPDLFYLDNVSFYGEDPNLVNEKYNFNYYEPGPGSSTSPLYLSTGYKDWWGYSCPTVQLLPQRTIDIAPIGVGYPYTTSRDVGYEVHRDGNEDSKKLGMLKSIKYPTGGETEFIYEGNQYDWVPYYQPGNTYLSNGPGLRIKEVISKPVNGGKDIHKLYKYGVYEDGRGYINEILRPGSASRANMMVAEGNCMHFWTFQLPGGNPPQIGSNNQTGYRTRDYFSDPYISFDLSGTLIKYDAVSEYLVEDDVPKQKTTNSYSWGDREWVSDFIVVDRGENIYNPRKFADPQFAWLTPVLRNKSIFKYNDGQFNIIRNEAYDYTAGFSYLNEAWDMPTYLHTNVVYTRPSSSLKDAARNYHNNSCSVYGYGFRKYTTGKQFMYHSVIEEFTPNGVIKTEKNLDYDNTTYLPRSEELVNSKNELTKTTYTYPFDFPTMPVYQQMVQKNILAPVIETTTSVNGIQTKKTVTNYYNPFSNVFVPQSIEIQTGNKPQEVVANFNRYDNLGHILEQQKNNNVKEVYLWGYQSRYPVAKILNTTYDIANTYITQSVLDGAIGNGDDATLRGHLNNLRNIPGALVETYTYKPLVGITSLTDINGRTSYYEYDWFGRLVYIRDNDNNILKKYAYDYQGQCTTCGAMSSANWQATGKTRSKPCEANTAFNGPYRQREEKDTNPASPTYNQSRWVDYPVDDESLYHKNEQYWVNTSTPPKCIQINVQNTGEQEQEQVYIDPNPCHLGQNDIRWKNTGMNTNACPLPPLWTSGELSRTFYSSLCTSPAEPDPIQVNVPAGMFTSTISPDDADGQAWQYAQTYADQHGGCTVPPINFTFINNAGVSFTVTLTDANTGQEYRLGSLNGADAYYQNLPQGIYHIYMSPTYPDDWRYYEVGCNYFTEAKGDVYISDISINASCNTITVY